MGLKFFSYSILSKVYYKLKTFSLDKINTHHTLKKLDFF